MSFILNIGDKFTCKSSTVVTLKAYNRSYGDFVFWDVDFGGKDMLLVFNSEITDEEKRKIIKDSCTIPDYPCSDWPIDYYKDENSDLFFYICNKMPESYVTIGDIITKGILHPSVICRADIAITIANAFNEYRINGLHVTDFCENLIGVDMGTGKVFFGLYQQLSSDMTDAVPFYRFAPPAFLKKEEAFEEQTDCYLLAVLLFAVFFAAHPYEGKKLSEHPFLTSKLLTEIYRDNPVFIMDYYNDSNRPLKILQPDIETLWNYYSVELCDEFAKAFSPDVNLYGKNKTAQNPAAPAIAAKSRRSAIEWLAVLTTFRSNTYICPSCRRNAFIDSSLHGVCAVCKTEYKPGFYIETFSSKLPAFDGGRIYTCQIRQENGTRATSPVGIIISNPNNPTELGVKNISAKQWRVITPSGNKKDVEHKDIVPMINGMQIFTPNGNFKIISTGAVFTFDSDFTTLSEKPDAAEEKVITVVADEPEDITPDSTPATDDTASDSATDISADTAPATDNSFEKSDDKESPLKDTSVSADLTENTADLGVPATENFVTLCGTEK